MSTSEIIPNEPAKPLQGKYDGRCLSPRQIARRNRSSGLGPKPNWLKNLTRNSAFSILKELGDKQAWTELYAQAVESKDARLRFEILRYLTDRRDGKPYVAENPADSSSKGQMNDNRLQIAAQSLTVIAAPKPKRKYTKKLQAAPADQQAIQAGKNPPAHNGK